MSVEYKFCPLCGTPLIQRQLYGHLRLACPACTFVRFHDPKVGVIGLITHEDHLLLTRRAVEPEKGKWSLPGGYMDAGEMPEETLRRELREELALEVEINHLLEIFPMVVGNQPSRGLVLVYCATPADGQRRALTCSDDVCEATWFTVDNLPTELAFVTTPLLLQRWKDGEIH